MNGGDLLLAIVFVLIGLCAAAAIAWPARETRPEPEARGKDRVFSPEQSARDGGAP